MEYVTLNNGVKMPMAGIGTFLLTPDEAQASVMSALECGYRLIDTANAYVNEKAVGDQFFRSHPAAGDELSHAGHPQPPTSAANPLDGLIPVAKAPRRGVDLKRLAAEVGAQIDQSAPLL